MILPNGIDLSNAGIGFIRDTTIEDIAGTAGAAFEFFINSHLIDYYLDIDNVHQVNEWLVHHMNERRHSTNFVTPSQAQQSKSIATPMKMTTDLHFKWIQFMA